jgi:transcriptional regulator with XRE-family HTH domain
MNAANTPSLGKNMRRLRMKRGWSMIKMCDAIGMKQSSLSKVENGLMSLSYDRLVEVARRLEIDISDLFMTEPEGRNSVAASARICVDRANDAKPVKWENFRYRHFGVEVKERLMIPMYGEVTPAKGRPEREFGGYSGERFLYVIDGTIEFHSEFYETYTLNAGDAIYFDIRMKHSFVAPEGKKAKCLLVTASEDRKFMEMERALASQGLSNIAELEQQTRGGGRRKR